MSEGICEHCDQPIEWEPPALKGLGNHWFHTKSLDCDCVPDSDPTTTAAPKENL